MTFKQFRVPTRKMVAPPVPEEVALWMLELSTERRYDKVKPTETLQIQLTDSPNTGPEMISHSTKPNVLDAASGGHSEPNPEPEMTSRSPKPNVLDAASGSHKEPNQEPEMTSHSPKPNALDAASGSQSVPGPEQVKMSQSPKPNALDAASGGHSQANDKLTKTTGPGSFKKTKKKYTKAKSQPPIRKPTKRSFNANNPKRRSSHVMMSKAKVEQLEKQMLRLYKVFMTIVSLYDQRIKQNDGEPSTRKKKFNAEQQENGLSPVHNVGSPDSGISFESSGNESTTEFSSSNKRQSKPKQKPGPLNATRRSNVVYVSPAQLKILDVNTKILYEGLTALLSFIYDKPDTNDTDNENSGTEAEQPNTTKNVKVDDDDLVPIGKGNAKVPARVLKLINWDSYTSATRKLLQALFPRNVLATHSLTGKPSPAFSHRPAKKILDPKLIEDIIITVSKNCGVPISLVRNCITIKCSDEAKLYRSRQKKQEARKAQNENGKNM